MGRVCSRRPLYLPTMPVHYRPAQPADAPACITLRGQTRQNAISRERLAAMGITAESWADGIRSGRWPGQMCLADEAEPSPAGKAQPSLAGYCFADRDTGEVLVLALLPAFEGQGIGQRLLGTVVAQLATLGWRRLHLGCSTDPASRSHGFYRYLGWRSTGQLDANGDELLELLLPDATAPTSSTPATTTGAPR